MTINTTMTTSNNTAIITDMELPHEVWWHIGSFLDYNNLAAFFQTCRTAHALSEYIFQTLANSEQLQMKVPLQGLRLSKQCVVSTWCQLDPESCFKVSVSLKNSPSCSTLGDLKLLKSC